MAEEAVGIDVGKLLAGGFAVVSGSIALVGGFTGTTARILRNDYWYFLIPVGLALVAVGLTLMASQFKKTSTHWRIGLTLGGFLVFSISALTMVVGMKDSLIKIDQPKIAVTWKDPEEGIQPIATIKVGIDGVQTENTLYVIVHPGEKITADNVQGVVTNYTLYQARVGANLDGIAEMTFDVQVPEGYGSLQVVAALDQIRDCAGKVEPGSPSTPTSEIPKDQAGQPVSQADVLAASVPASTTALQPTDAGTSTNFSCVIALAPLDGVVPPPISNVLTPLSTSIVTVTTTPASPPAN